MVWMIISSTIFAWYQVCKCHAIVLYLGYIPRCSGINAAHFTDISSDVCHSRLNRLYVFTSVTCQNTPICSAEILWQLIYVRPVGSTLLFCMRALYIVGMSWCISKVKLPMDAMSTVRMNVDMTWRISKIKLPMDTISTIRMNVVYSLTFIRYQDTTYLATGHHDPDSKVHGPSTGPIWGRQDPGGPHVGPMNFAILGSSWLHVNMVVKMYLN